jgi:hypothetical protein
MSIASPPRTFRFRSVENVFLVAHTDKPPHDEEWAAYLEAILSFGRQLGGDLRRARQMVFTDGAGPDANQRRMAAKAAQQMNATQLPQAVITSSRFVRVIVTALTAFNMNIKVWEPRDVRGAFDFLGIGPATARSIWIDLRRMDDELGGVKAIREAREVFDRA